MAFPDRVVRIEEGALVISFRYQPALKDSVKAIPGSRWDPTSRVWRVAAAHASAALSALEALHFHVEGDADELTSAATAAGEESHRTPDGVPPLTVSRLNARATAALGAAFPDPVWVAGEITNLSSRGGTLWFTLVERDGTGQPASMLQAVLFSQHRTAVEAALALRGLTLEEELKVCLRGRPSLYVQRGTWQIVVDGIDPEYSAGELARRKEEVLAQLRREGVLHINRELPVPRLPLRVALLTSIEGDARHDVVRSLADSGYPFDVTILDVRVQGPSLERTVLSALSLVARQGERFDVCVVARGGGSQAELGGWDNLVVGRAVARLPVKVLVAIGHEADHSVLDEVAWSARTPTAAAMALVDAVSSAERGLEELAQRVGDVARERIAVARRGLGRRGERFSRTVELALRTQKHRAWLEWEERLSRGARTMLRHAQRRVDAHATVRTASRALARLRREESGLQRASGLIDRQSLRSMGVSRARLGELEQRTHALAHRRLQQAEERLADAASKVRLADPITVLQRGFSVVRNSEGRSIRRVSELVTGEAVSVELTDGLTHLTLPELTTRPRSGRTGAPGGLGTPEATEE